MATLTPTEIENLNALRKSLGDPNAQLAGGSFVPGGVAPPQQPDITLTDTAENRETLNLADEARRLSYSTARPKSPTEIATELQIPLQKATAEAFPQTQPTQPTQPTQLTGQDRFFFTKEGGSVRYFNKEGKELQTNPIGGDQFRLNPEGTPGITELPSAPV